MIALSRWRVSACLIFLFVIGVETPILCIALKRISTQSLAEHGSLFTGFISMATGRNDMSGSHSLPEWGANGNGGKLCAQMQFYVVK